MNDIEFAALLVSRVCHDLVSPVSAVGNGLEVLADERDAGMRADALKLVTSSAEQVAARLKFSRIAFGAAGAVGSIMTADQGTPRHWPPASMAGFGILTLFFGMVAGFAMDRSAA